MSPLTEEAIIRALDAFTALIGQQQPTKPKCGVDVHLDREVLRELQEFVDAVAEEQGEARRRLRALEDWIGLDDLKARPDLGVVSMRLRSLERRIADSYAGIDHHAIVRDATAHIEEQVVALGTQVQELQGQMAQAEQRQNSWRRGIDMILGRRPRG